MDRCFIFSSTSPAQWWRCVLSILWPVRKPVTTRDCVKLKVRGTDSNGDFVKTAIIRRVRIVAVHLSYVTYIWLSVSKLPLKCAVVSLYSVVKQRLKCNTGKVCNCLIQFILTVVLSIGERVFLIEYVFIEGNRYTDLVQEQFAEIFHQTFICGEQQNLQCIVINHARLTLSLLTSYIYHVPHR
jgi:hypothetical protein